MPRNTYTPSRNEMLDSYLNSCCIIKSRVCTGAEVPLVSARLHIYVYSTRFALAFLIIEISSFQQAYAGRVRMVYFLLSCGSVRFGSEVFVLIN